MEIYLMLKKRLQSLVQIALISSGLLLCLSSPAKTIKLTNETFKDADKKMFRNNQIVSPSAKKKGFKIISIPSEIIKKNDTIAIFVSAPKGLNSPIGIGADSRFITINGDFVGATTNNAKVNIKGRSYLLPKNMTKGNFIIMVKRVKSSFKFYLAGGKYKFLASDKGPKKDGPLQIIIPVVKKGEEPIIIKKIILNTQELPKGKTPKISPYFTMRSGYIKSESKEVRKALKLDSINGKITKNELEGLEQALLVYPKPTTNVGNSQFRRNYVPHTFEWLYQKNKNIELLNKLIDYGRSVYNNRNDNLPKDKRYKLTVSSLGYKMEKKDPYAKCWPHYQGATTTENYEIKINSGCASFSSISWLTVPVRIIANNKELWKKKYQGKTYKQIAVEFMGYSESTINYFYNTFLDKSTYTLKYPKGDPRAGEYLIFNRYLPFSANTVALAEAYETLKIKPNYVSLIDKVNGNMLNVIWKFSRKEGSKYLYYPYSSARKTGSEDFGHGSFDGRGFMILFKSGRYNFPLDTVKRIGNTFNDKYIKAPGEVYKWPNHRLKKNYNYIPGMEGMIWYGTWNKDIQKNITEYLINKLKVVDTRIYWEIFKVKENYYNTVGPVWGKQRPAK